MFFRWTLSGSGSHSVFVATVESVAFFLKEE